MKIGIVGCGFEGATYYGIGAGIARIARAIEDDEGAARKTISPLSTGDQGLC